ncbi:hypothetical protein J2785_005386 [Burkholderia ambifaria]|nr:DUF6039 family protein [Burkholderia ambifaria]MDR6502206.1 hypothetical protein [Burkholderia ambifaria]
MTDNRTSRDTRSLVSAAAAQLPNGAAAMHSLNAGMVIHREAQVHYDYLSEARAFAIQLQNYMNMKLSPDAVTLVYEEVFGSHGKMHWLVHMKTPSDYGRLLDLVDHDKAFQDIYQEDRLPERGGGNWERIFVQGSFREHVIVPQHGFAREAMDELDPRSFLPPARHQIAEANAPFLHSGNCGVLVFRSLQARYESRDLARFYLSEWQTVVNARLGGSATVAQFEEMWGTQDRLHLLIHFRDLDACHALRQLEATDAALRELMGKPRVNLRGERAAWGGLFETGSMRDVVMLAVEPNRP